MRLVLTFFIFLLSLTTSWALELNQTHLVNGCKLISWTGVREKNFPGSFCQFFDDGRLLTGVRHSLKMLDKNSAMIWEYRGHIHHQVNRSEDLQRILVMTSDFIDPEGKNYRIDRFLILSNEGKVLLSQSATELMKQVNLKGYRPVELTHFNSFYEIPEITGKAPEYIKKGNYIANSMGVGIFILSPDLKNVLHFRKIHTSSEHHVHDAQILPNGHMLYFNNSHVPNSDKLPFSTIEELDLNNDKVVFEFRAKPESAFFSRFCGGVQKIDEDTYLFSHMLTGTFVYSKKQKRILKYLYQTHLEEFDHFFPTQQVKAIDLRAFLSHWK